MHNLMAVCLRRKRALRVIFIMKGWLYVAYISCVANKLLCTPFDNKAAISEEISYDLTVNEFFEHCYSSPFFQKDITELKKFKDENIDNYDYPTNWEDLQNQCYNASQGYKNFKAWLENFRNHKIYTISGHAGTGKTTLINYLKYNYPNQNLNWVILDMTHSQCSFEWCYGEKTVFPQEEFVSAHKKVFSIILMAIRDILFPISEETGFDDASILKNLKSFCDVFNMQFASRHPAGWKFFDSIGTILSQTCSDTDKIMQLAIHCRTYFSEINKKNYGEAIQDALDVLLLILRCSNPMDVRFIIAFDNLERFVSTHEIYSQQIVDIRKNILSYSIDVNHPGKVHQGIFKFLLLVRNTTAGYGERLQSLDELASRLDINGWYDIHDIICRKKQWYEMKKFNTDDIRLVEQIAGDMRVCNNGTITGLKLQLDALFNGNTRLIIDFIGMIVEQTSNTYAIEEYKSHLEDVITPTGDRSLQFRDTSSISKFAARSIIRGLLLKGLRDSDNLFQHLKTYTSNSDVSGLGITRNILTILFNHTNNDSEAEITLEQAIGELLCITDVTSIWQSAKFTEERKIIAEVLFYMNSYNRRDNDWIQFIDLQYRGAHENIVINSPSVLDEMLGKELSNFTISIMPAGVAYLKYIVASFEFFSLRYTPAHCVYKPLFTLIPSPDEIKNCNINNLPCIKVCKLVRNKVSHCIQIMADSNSDFELFVKSNRTKFHTERIIQQHITYLNSFIQFIEERFIWNSTLPPKIVEKYRSLLNSIRDIRNEY